MVQALLGHGKEAERQGNLAQAMGDYAAALRADPNNPEVNFRTGLLKGRSADFTGAAASFQRALAANPDFAEAHYNLGLTLIAQSKNPEWTSALVEFQAAAKLKPDYSEAQNMIGVSLLETGAPGAAIPQFRSALRLGGNSAELHFNLGRAFEATGNTAAASTEYAAALAQRQSYPEADQALANLLFLSANYAAAAKRYQETLAKNPDLEAAHYGLAKTLQAEGQRTDAKVEFRQVKELLQRQSDAIQPSHLSNESLELAKQGNFEKAIETARQAVALEPERAVPHYNLALLLADSGQFQPAILEIREAISLAPLQAVFYVNLSRMQQKLGDATDALESLHRAALFNPNMSITDADAKTLNAALPTGRAQRDPREKIPMPYGASTDTAADHFAFATQLTREGDVEGAIGELLRSVALEPDRSDLRYNLALAYEQNGQNERAALEFRKVLLLNANDANSLQAHLALGATLLRMKDFTAAAVELRRVLSLQPHNQEAAHLLSQCLQNAVPSADTAHLH
jgi:tetratricopeptide (TPR) repeat protein